MTENITIKHNGLGWVGFDLDGTIIPHGNNDDVINHRIIGEPYAEIVQLIHKHKAEGHEIKIFTARVSLGCGYDMSNASVDRILFAKQARESIQTYCLVYFGEIFDVTCEKDFNCVRIYDDRARHVICNTGKVCCNG